MINEAALLTARTDGSAHHHVQSLEEAIDRVIAGPERKTRAMSDKEKKVTAYHEGGHALVGLGAAQPRPGAQGDDPAARPVARAHAGAADRGQVHRRPGPR